MAEPTWVSEATALAIHQRQIAEHGGLDGVRDEALLASALARPRQIYNYSDPKPSIAELAAAYAYGIARNHAFIDGNKRTAHVIYRLFLKLNGGEIKASQGDKYQLMIHLAAGEMSEEELARQIAEMIKA